MSIVPCLSQNTENYSFYESSYVRMHKVQGPCVARKNV